MTTTPIEQATDMHTTRALMLSGLDEKARLSIRMEIDGAVYDVRSEPISESLRSILRAEVSALDVALEKAGAVKS